MDLNRNFPDQYRSVNPRRQPETQALIKWIEENPFVLSANLHGGSVVASYPFDDSKKHAAIGFYSGTPDDSVFVMLAKTYANNHLTMVGHEGCYQGEHFPGGITNGAHWYDVPGKFLLVRRPRKHRSCYWGALYSFFFHYRSYKGPRYQY